MDRRKLVPRYGTVTTFAPNSEIWAGEKGGTLEDLGSMLGSMDNCTIIGTSPRDQLGWRL